MLTARALLGQLDHTTDYDLDVVLHRGLRVATALDNEWRAA